MYNFVPLNNYFWDLTSILGHKGEKKFLNILFKTTAKFCLAMVPRRISYTVLTSEVFVLFWKVTKIAFPLLFEGVLVILLWARLVYVQGDCLLSSVCLEQELGVWDL